MNCRGCEHVKKRLDRVEREMEATRDLGLPLDRCLAFEDVSCAPSRRTVAAVSTEATRLLGQLAPCNDARANPCFCLKC